jgi:ribonuclease HI
MSQWLKGCSLARLVERKDTMTFNLTIYTDGSCWPNPGPGGWGALLMDHHSPWKREICGSVRDTTSSRMELTAALEALWCLEEACHVSLYSDSQYVVRGMREWIYLWQVRDWWTTEGTPVANRDLWQELWGASEKHIIRWRWVKGHAGHPYNERAHQLAEAAREAVEDQGIT